MVTDVLHSWWTWAETHRMVVLAVIVWIIANVIPRPHPEDLTGWKKTFWMLVDRLCVLTAQEMPGRVKWFFSLSPRASEGASTSDTKKDDKES